MPDSPSPQWRRHAARAMQAAPAPIRRTFWSARRSAARTLRRARERREDYSRSQPALHGIDRELASRLGSGGFFVEAGAFDGYTQSNTYFLERARGWRGLLIEPVPALAREARRERRRSTVVNCALGLPASRTTRFACGTAAR